MLGAAAIEERIRNDSIASAFRRFARACDRFTIDLRVNDPLLQHLQGCTGKRKETDATGSARAKGRSEMTADRSRSLIEARLPEEVLIACFSYLSSRSLIQIELISTRWRRLSRDASVSRTHALLTAPS